MAAEISLPLLLLPPSSPPDYALAHKMTKSSAVNGMFELIATGKRRRGVKNIDASHGEITVLCCLW